MNDMIEWGKARSPRKTTLASGHLVHTMSYYYTGVLPTRCLL